MRLPEHRSDELRKIRSAILETGNTDPAGLSTTTGIDEETVKILLPFTSKTVSLDTPIKTPDGDTGEALGNLLLPVDVDFLEPISNSELWNVLQHLPKRQQEVLMHRHGAFGRGKMTLQEIADTYGITRERVRQIEAQALTACRRLMSND